MRLILKKNAPFSLKYSSCSNRVPLNFKYRKNTNSFCRNIDLFVDGAIIDYTKLSESSSKNWVFGWFCESREIRKDLYAILLNDNVLQNLKKLGMNKIFTCDYSLLEIDSTYFQYNPNGSNLPWIPSNQYGIYPKSKNLSMVCSDSNKTYGHKLRLSVAKEIQHKIDLFGGAWGSPKIGDKLEGYVEDLYTWRSKLPALRDYRFSIVFENANYDKYYTEKITDCFATGTIPVYWGTRKIAEDFDQRGIIFWDDLSSIDELTSDLYEQMLPYVKINFDLVGKLKSADDQLYNAIVNHKTKSR